MLAVSSLVALLAGSQVVGAQTDGQVHVSAGVTDLTPITLTLCDTTAGSFDATTIRQVVSG